MKSPRHVGQICRLHPGAATRLKTRANMAAANLTSRSAARNRVGLRLALGCRPPRRGALEEGLWCGTHCPERMRAQWAGAALPAILGWCSRPSTLAAAPRPRRLSLAVVREFQDDRALDSRGAHRLLRVLLAVPAPPGPRHRARVRPSRTPVPPARASRTPRSSASPSSAMSSGTGSAVVREHQRARDRARRCALGWSGRYDCASLSFDEICTTPAQQRGALRAPDQRTVVLAVLAVSLIAATVTVSSPHWGPHRSRPRRRSSVRARHRARC